MSSRVRAAADANPFGAASGPSAMSATLPPSSSSAVAGAAATATATTPRPATENGVHHAQLTPSAPFPRRMFLFDAFNEDELKLAEIRSTMLRTESLTDEMIKILNGFDRRLADLEKTLQPIEYMVTTCSRTYDNVDATLHEVGKVLERFEIQHQVEVILRRGVVDDLDHFLLKFDQLLKAETYLRENEKVFKSAKEALEKLGNTRQRAVLRCHETFERILSKFSSPLDLQTRDVPAAGIPWITKTSLDELSRLAERLRQSDHLAHLKVYKTQRGAVLEGILRNYHKRFVVPEEESAARASMRYEKGSHILLRWIRLYLAIVHLERAVAMQIVMTNGEIRQFNSVFRETLAESFKFFVNVCEEVVGRRKTSSLTSILFGGAGTATMTSSSSSLSLSSSSSSSGPMIGGLSMSGDASAAGGLSAPGSAAGTLSMGSGGAAASAGPGAGSSLETVYVVFDVLETLLSLRPDFQQVLKTGSSQDTSANVYIDKFSDLYTSCSNVGADILKRALHLFHGMTSSKQLPKDGTVHELTSRTVNFLKRLIEYRISVDQILQERSSLRKKMHSSGAGAGGNSKEVDLLSAKHRRIDSVPVKRDFDSDDDDDDGNSGGGGGGGSSGDGSRGAVSDDDDDDDDDDADDAGNGDHLVGGNEGLGFSHRGGSSRRAAGAGGTLSASKKSVQNQQLQHDRMSTVTAGTVNSSSLLSMDEEEDDAATVSLASFIMRVLQKLDKYLSAVAKQYKNPVLEHLFLMNNKQYIVKGIKNSALISLVSSQYVSIGDVWVGKEKEAMMEASWFKARRFLQDELNEEITKKNEKEQLKKRFSGFNEVFEQQVERQQKYAIPDQDLRRDVRKTVMDAIIPEYARMLQKYGDVPFTSNRAKYVKFDVPQVTDRLQHLFEA